ncbi:MAG: hypothetical protein H0T79_20310 [Deltaproteobacteria bacterium]|nr:hypothetical protein [Deltaproteobacteria bacterium]
MSNFQSEIQRLVEGFVSQLTVLWRRAATDALTGLDSGGGRGGRPRGGGGGGGSSSSGGSAASRRKGEKRTADELDELQDKFQEFVKDNPGLRIEQINKQLGTTTKDLQLPIRKLIADGALKAKGEKRSTQYFAGEGSPRKRAKKK